MESSSFTHPSLNHFLTFANSNDASKWTDVTLIVSQEDKKVSFHCHRLVLAAHSPFLKRIMEEHSLSNDGDCAISLVEVSAEEVEKVLQFMYKGEESECFDPNVVKSLGVRTPNLNDGVSAEKTCYNESSGTQLKDFSPEKKDHLSSEEPPPLLQSTSTGSDKAPLHRKKKVVKRKRSADPKGFECCDQKFDNPLFYIAHKDKVHSEMPGGDQFIICCNKKFLDDFKKHLEATHKLDDETKKAECCESTFEGLDDLTKHCSSTHGLRLSTFKRILCCATRINSIEDYKKHKEEDRNHLECSQCAFISKDARHMNSHLYRKHKIGDEPAEKSALTCKYCSKTFKRITLRQAHEDKHDDNYKYSCDVCGKKFKLLSSLRSHLYRMGKNHKPDVREYQCDTCDKTFNTVVDKRKHTRVTHEKRATPECSECHMIFVDRHSLNNHIKVAHIKVKDIQCTSCGKLFATQERMRVHERFVHVVENKKVPCDVCKKEFINRERMIDHKRSVHRDRKYQCESCGSTFKNSSTLKSHVVSLHLDHDKKPLKCSFCNKGFLHESRLKAHEMIHGDEEPYSCRFCGRPNKCKNNNLKHEKRCKKKKDPLILTSSENSSTLPGEGANQIVVEANAQPGIEIITSEDQIIEAASEAFSINFS